MIAEAKRRVLIIEDNEINREILCEILSPKYDIIQAENGQIGLDLLAEYGSAISLILLDIHMPVMDGYSFLDAVRTMKCYANIPIIVTTSSADITDEIKCLENGATDFVIKPYNFDIVLRRVESMIRLSEASALVSKIEFDSLTGFYSKEFFYINAERILSHRADIGYDMICFDVKSYELIEEKYGKKASEKLLLYISESVKRIFGSDALYGRLYTDLFSVLVSHKNGIFDHLQTQVAELLKDAPIPNAVFHAGIYENVGHDIPVALICNNAIMPIRRIENKYGVYVASYDEQIKNSLIREQTILDSIKSGLEERQLTVYYQPKQNLKNGEIGGAEALSRWIHPVHGFISPGEYIPVFEKNGFIYTFDKYMLERVCEDICSWIERGLSAVPVSINLSRIDFSDKDILRNIINIVNKYNIPRELLHFEVTESAYVEDAEFVFSTLHKIRELGFHIELDDFGAGYSSLNVLTDIDIDILKLDMSLVKNISSARERIILEHVLDIAHALEMDVVAEGVETEEQMTALKQMGCDYIQGYYYSKPVSKDEYEKFL